MERDHLPPARRHLLDRPQRLGVLPTLWFWNDHERHRRGLPIVLLLTLPWTPVLFFLTVRFNLPMSLFVVVNILAPYLAMGLIERHIRSELHRRALVAAVNEPHVRASVSEQGSGTLQPQRPQA